MTGSPRLFYTMVQSVYGRDIFYLILHLAALVSACDSEGRPSSVHGRGCRGRRMSSSVPKYYWRLSSVILCHGLFPNGHVSSSLPIITGEKLFGGMSIQAEARVTDCVLFGSPVIQPDRFAYQWAHAPLLHSIRVVSLLVTGESYIRQSYG